MKKNSKPKFDNTLLKRWLLKVGPVRRKILLTKFRADLRRRGLSKLAWREGLLQLSSRPFVSLIRDPTPKPTERKDRMRGPKSKRKGSQPPRDSNNNDNDLGSQEFSPAASFSCLNGEHMKKARQDPDRKSDHHHSEYNRTCSIAPMPDNSNKLVRVGGSERRGSSASQRSREPDRPSRKKKKHRVPKEGVNPNSINWHLINIEMKDPLKSPGPRFLQLRQIEKKKKKDRLYAKFSEIFGEDIDPPECNRNKSPPSTKTKETSKEQIPETTIRCKESELETRKINEKLDRRSPTFSNRCKKRRRDHHSVENRKKSMSTETSDALRGSVTDDNASTEPVGDTAVLEEEINGMQNDTLMTNWTISTDSLVEDQVTINHHSVAAVAESDTDSRSTICTIDKTAETDQRRNSSLEEDCQRGELSEGEPLGLELEMESDQESCIIIDAPQASVDIVPAARQQSVIVKFDQDHDELFEASLIRSDSTLQSESLTSQETDHTGLHEAEARDLTSPDNGTLTIEAAMENTILQILNLPNTTKDLKDEPKNRSDPAPSESWQFQRASPSLPDQEPPNIAVPENDPKPSSTTDTETNTPLRSGMTCVNDRLLGALDNIYLALHCRRRLQERVQTASKLAIKRNRQEEELKAQHEFESRLIIFRDELCYLFGKLDTWDRVLRFIAQGLDHRTPPGIKRFSAAEVEQAMLDAEVKPPLGSNSDKKSSEVPNLKLVGRVLCTIDLTEDCREDDKTIDLCDSSTDPPRSQKHSIVNPEFESTQIDVDGFQTHDLNANEIQLPLPSIAEVRTISPQQFETIGDKSEFSTAKNEDPCYLCSRASHVACGRCAKATYCSKDCQVVHWEQSHHATCVPLDGGIPCNI